MGLVQDIEDIRKGIKAGRFNNEAAVSQGIILRLLHALSWPAYDTEIVCPEYSLEGRRVDYALCHPYGKPVAFVEVKQIGQSEGAERQLFEYAFHIGVPLAVLTDGQVWNFFLPGEQGDYGERRVYKLDIVERDAAECVSRFNRYLHYEAIRSGAALENARADYRNESRDRQMRSKFPVAWEKLVEEEDELLIELLADQVENLCGYKPDPDMVANFLKENIVLREGGREGKSKASAIEASKPTLAHVLNRSNTSASSAIGFTLHGRFYPAKNAIDVLKQFYEELTSRDITFPERFASLPKHGSKRRYLAKNPDDLYPGRPDFAARSVKKLNSEFWYGTHYSRQRIEAIIKLACGVADLNFGKDIAVNLGG
jgi:predicted type IV restriction endonuclease